MPSSFIPTDSAPQPAIGPYALYYHATEKQQDFDWELLWTVEQGREPCAHVKESLGGFKERCKFLDRLTEKLPRSCPPVAVNTPDFAVTGEALDQDDAMDLDGPRDTNTSDFTGPLPVSGPQDVVGPCTVNQLWRSAPYEHVRMPQLESVRESRWVRENHEAMWKWRRDGELRAKQRSKFQVWQIGSDAFGAVGGSLRGY